MIEMNNVTQEMLALEKKDRRTNLKKFCNSILQKIGELDNCSGDRAIWELCQNARDLSEEAVIKITLDNDKFIFAHKGRPFNEDSLLSLVKQVSSEEKENTDTAGQFGTGFVTTHYFNRKFYLNGSFQTESGKIFDINNFEIDRSEDDISLFIDKMGKQIQDVYDLLNTPEANLREWTELIYPLNERTCEIALRAMRTSEIMLPYVLVLNDKIKTVTLENRIDGRNIVYTKDIFYQKNDLNVLEIKKQEGCTSNNIPVYFLQQEDCKIILPLKSDDCAKSTDNITKLFIWFPLLGTESWGTNFVFHSSFYPLEKRNGMILPCDNTNVQKKYEYNVNVLQKMNTLLFDYLKTHAYQIKNGIEMAKVNFAAHIVDDAKTMEFYKSQQETWTNVFRTLPLIDTPIGRKSLDEGVKIPNKEICSFFEDKNNNDKYFDAFYEYASAVNILPNKDICLKWAEIIHQWRLSDEVNHEISLYDVAQKVTVDNDFNKLHHFLEIIKETKQTKLFETIALIPNRYGELRTAINLNDGKNIPDELFNRVSSICPEEMKKLVNPNFSDICNLQEYTRENIRIAVNSANDKIKQETIRVGKCFPQEYTTALRNYVSIYSTEYPSGNRHRIMQSLSELKGFKYEICYISKVDEKEQDYCQSAFIFLLESELLEISNIANNTPNWLNFNKVKLLDFVSNVAMIKDTDYSSRLLGSNGYAVIPNQLGVLCKMETLTIRENQITNELADMYFNVQGQELRNNWVDDSFSQFISADKIVKAKDIAKTIESVLLEEFENTRQVNQYIIDIIRKIETKTEESKLWKEWFKRIEEKKADLNWHMVPEDSKSSFYRLMKVANNKELLEDLADFSENTFLMNQFKEFLQKQQQDKTEFEFKHGLGKHIEMLIRKKLTEELGARLSVCTTIEDLQSGQDLVVKLDGKEVFFIECKAKWNFNEPAHMSKLQIRKACEENGRYALCAVDLTNFNGSLNAFPSIDELMDCIHIHLDVADKLANKVEHLFAIDDEFDETQMTVSADYKSNIPKSVFINNIGFDVLINAILKEIEKK